MYNSSIELPSLSTEFHLTVTNPFSLIEYFPNFIPVLLTIFCSEIPRKTLTYSGNKYVISPLPFTVNCLSAVSLNIICIEYVASGLILSFTSFPSWSKSFTSETKFAKSLYDALYVCIF